VQETTRNFPVFMDRGQNKKIYSHRNVHILFLNISSHQSEAQKFVVEVLIELEGFTLILAGISHSNINISASNEDIKILLPHIFIH
jgi:hypothetical protein